MRKRLGLTLGLALLVGLAGATPVHALNNHDHRVRRGQHDGDERGASPVNFGPTADGVDRPRDRHRDPAAGPGHLVQQHARGHSDGPGTFTLWVTEKGLTGPLGTVGFFSGLTTNLLTGG